MLSSLLGNAPGAIMYSFLGSFMNNVTDTHGYKVPLKSNNLSFYLKSLDS